MRTPVLVTGAALLLAACGGAATAAGSNQTAVKPSLLPTSLPSAAPAPAVVAIADNPLGKIVTDARGRSLYYFEPDRGGHPTCSGACARVWPPALLGDGAEPPAPVPGLTGQLASVSRPEGQQITYNSWPLYTFAQDQQPGDTHGQGVTGFGGRWFVVTPGLTAAAIQVSPAPSKGTPYQSRVMAPARSKQVMPAKPPVAGWPY